VCQVTIKQTWTEKIAKFKAAFEALAHAHVRVAERDAALWKDLAQSV
jgi:hypothetical protein